MDIQTTNIEGALGRYYEGRGPRVTEDEPRIGGGTQSFANALSQSWKDQTPTATDRRQQANAAASGLLAHALILPILKQVRRDVLAPKGVFSQGIGEKTFGPEFDMQIAGRIAQSPKMQGIANRLADKLLQRQQPDAATSENKTGPATTMPGVDVNG